MGPSIQFQINLFDAKPTHFSYKTSKHIDINSLPQRTPKVQESSYNASS